MKITKIAVDAQHLPAFVAVADSSWNGLMSRDFVAAHAGVQRTVKPRTATPAVKATYVRGTAQVLIPDPNPPV